MGNISSEQKLTMLNQLRSQYSQNQSDLMHREQILYGRTSVHAITENRESVGGDSNSVSTRIPIKRSFQMRLLLAVILAVALILCDQQEKEFLGVSTTQICNMISKDHITEIMEKSEELP